MFRVYTVSDTVRVDPAYFKIDLPESIAMILRDKNERRVDPDLGIVLSIWNPRDISEGRVIPGDGASYHKVVFDVLAYLPEVNEIVEGEVSEVVEFGAFVKIGPLDGLVHLSQITSDFLTFDKKLQAFVGRESRKTLKKGDVVKAKVSVVSVKGNIADTKVGLTMRPDGLGKEEWLSAKAAGGGKPAGARSEKVDTRQRREKPDRRQRRERGS
ncbi:MAG: DNA-directed RNA polymerase [Candidatus ainarchaeum sp.]|nr:DNA-directed RNA polymerase [Candidatus ainarchaeum sp.]